MATYQAPLADWQFLLHDVLRVEEQTHLPGFADLTPEFTSQVLGAAAQFHEEVLHPINLASDAAGARFENGRVRTPTGFAQAWQAYREAGWHRISLPETLGGAGLPPVMSVPISEMRMASGHSFSMYGSFCAPAANMLQRLAPDWIREHVVPKVAAGEWTATMCMTEPQAGTDLRQLNTRAVAQPDGSWRITGRKIFITGADHDLTDNIVHIVLAKVPDAEGRLSPGLESVSVFLVSSRKLDPHTGLPGEANGVSVQSIEHKMGIEASATCAVAFEEAIGWRISDERGQGSAANMAPMFMLMNYARVSTAMSGVAYAEIARQNAADYARERRSGRAGGTRRQPHQAQADPIIAHADVRRLLLESRAFAEGARAGGLRAAIWQSVAEHADDAQQRQQASDLLDVLTPVMKAFFTDRGFDAAVACQQVLGGHGYIKDYGLEQFVRNARIAQLYEGANGIQAMDLVQRKLKSHGGRACRAFFDTLFAATARHAGHPELGQAARQLETACGRLEAALKWLDTQQDAAPDVLGAAAYDVLSALGILYVGWNWLEILATLAEPQSCRHADPALGDTKRALAAVWYTRQLPLIEALCQRIESGNAGLLTLPDELI